MWSVPRHTRAAAPDAMKTRWRQRSAAVALAKALIAWLRRRISHTEHPVHTRTATRSHQGPVTVVQRPACLAARRAQRGAYQTAMRAARSVWRAASATKTRPTCPALRADGPHSIAADAVKTTAPARATPIATTSVARSVTNPCRAGRSQADPAFARSRPAPTRSDSATWPTQAKRGNTSSPPGGTLEGASGEVEPRSTEPAREHGGARVSSSHTGPHTKGSPACVATEEARLDSAESRHGTSATAFSLSVLRFLARAATVRTGSGEPVALRASSG